MRNPLPFLVDLVACGAAAHVAARAYDSILAGVAAAVFIGAYGIWCYVEGAAR